MPKNYSRHSPRLAIRRLSYLSQKRRKMFIVCASIVLIIVAMVATQLVFGASGKVRPGVKLATVSIGGLDEDQLLDIINTDYSSAKISFLIAGKKPISSPIQESGVVVDKDGALKDALSYPVWERFVPFTLFTKIGKVYELGLTVDKERFNEYAKTSLSPICLVKPEGAQVRVVDGKLELVEASSGYSCEVEDIIEVVRSAQFSLPETSIAVAPRAVEPAVSTEQARAAMSRAQELIQRQLSIVILGGAHKPATTEIAKWLEFVSDDATGKVTVSVSQDSLSKFIEGLQGAMYIKPGVTTVSMVDGKEMSRVKGVEGRGLDIKKGVQDITRQIQKGDGSVTLNSTAIAPSVVYDRQYTKTEAGLKSLVKELVSKGDVAISVREIGGRGWSANANGDKQYTTASTYKLFVAYAVLKNIESGSMKWSDSATGGHTVSACFDTMIINSDNPCSEWFGEKLGWKKITSMMHAIGVSSRTSLYTSNGFVGTTNDETNFLVKLQKGELLSSSSTKRLIDVMKRQIYRAGIPAGTGAVVADKVGFLNGLLHDAAIVYTPTGSYAITIFTKGGSWGAIADISRQIHGQLKY